VSSLEQLVGGWKSISSSLESAWVGFPGWRKWKREYLKAQGKLEWKELDASTTVDASGKIEQPAPAFCYPNNGIVPNHSRLPHSTSSDKLQFGFPTRIKIK